MADSRFYRNAGKLTLKQIIDLTQATLPEHQKTSPQTSFEDVATLMSAGEKDVSFLHNKKYIQPFQQSNAGLIFCLPEFTQQAPQHMIILETPVPYRAYAQVASAFYPTVEEDALVLNAGTIPPKVMAGPGVVLGEGVEIGEGTRIGANTVIGPGVKIGCNCLIGSHVTISHAILGDQVVVFPGVRVGQAGFGFFMDAKGHITVPQLGRVILEDCVEIGANATIDRGTLEDTVIGKGTRIDNLVQIGHGVRTGKNCVIVAQVGISGSTTLGDSVIAAGQVGLAGHLEIGDRVRIAAQAGVMRDVPSDEAIAGSPAVPVKQWHRQTVALARLATDRRKGTA